MDEILTCKNCGWSGSWKECTARIISEPVMTQQGESVNAVDVCPRCGDAIRPTVVKIADRVRWWEEDQLRAWLEENRPGILEEYESRIPRDLEETYFLALPFWAERYHPEIVEEFRKQRGNDE